MKKNIFGAYTLNIAILLGAHFLLQGCESSTSTHKTVIYQDNQVFSEEDANYSDVETQSDMEETNNSEPLMLSCTDQGALTGKTVMRRMSTLEFKYTLLDILSIPAGSVESFKFYPEDSGVDGFFNIANTLPLSEKVLKGFSNFIDLAFAESKDLQAISCSDWSDCKITLNKFYAKSLTRQPSEEELAPYQSLFDKLRGGKLDA